MIQRPENWAWEWEYKPTQLREDCLAGLASLRVWDGDKRKPTNLRSIFYSERVWVQNRPIDVGIYAWVSTVPRSDVGQWHLVCCIDKPVSEEALREAALNVVRLGLDTAPYGGPAS